MSVVSIPENYFRRFDGNSSSVYGFFRFSGRVVKLLIGFEKNGRQAVAFKCYSSKRWYGLVDKTNRSNLRLVSVDLRDGVRYFFLKTTGGSVFEVKENVFCGDWFYLDVPFCRFWSGVLYAEYSFKKGSDGDISCYFRETFSNTVTVYTSDECPKEYLAVFEPVPL